LSNEKIIEIQNLTKRFKEVTAVNKLNLNVYHGDVFGFLGPNGAGKSTTIRMLLTLIRPEEGNIKIFGKSLKEKRKEILKNIGAIVEKPDLYNYLSAYKNLEILGKISGSEVSKKKMMEILDIVGLADRYKSKVKTYSFGMKQRLGIAQALMHDPELIILDEPTTGLDPQGMKEIRELILLLSKEKGKTIFLSSHILSEVEHVANRMIIIDKGSNIIEGSVDELLKTKEIKVSIEVNDLERAKNILQTTLWNNKITSIDSNKIMLTLEKDEIPLINKYFVEHGISVNSIIPMRSLEEFFLNITKDK
jgi:ABC-2 type transport system ATP-binding protein